MRWILLRMGKSGGGPRRRRGASVRASTRAAGARRGGSRASVPPGWSSTLEGFPPPSDFRAAAGGAHAPRAGRSSRDGRRERFRAACAARCFEGGIAGRRCVRGTAGRAGGLRRARRGACPIRRAVFPRPPFEEISRLSSSRSEGQAPDAFEEPPGAQAAYGGRAEELVPFDEPSLRGHLSKKSPGSLHLRKRRRRDAKRGKFREEPGGPQDPQWIFQKNPGPRRREPPRCEIRERSGDARERAIR